MKTEAAYDIASDIELLLYQHDVKTDEDFYAVMSCLFRTRHKNAENSREDWDRDEYGDG